MSNNNIDNENEAEFINNTIAHRNKLQRLSRHTINNPIIISDRSSKQDISISSDSDNDEEYKPSYYYRKQIEKNKKKIKMEQKVLKQQRKEKLLKNECKKSQSSNINNNDNNDDDDIKHADLLSANDKKIIRILLRYTQHDGRYKTLTDRLTSAMKNNIGLSIEERKIYKTQIKIFVRDYGAFVEINNKIILSENKSKSYHNFQESQISDYGLTIQKNTIYNNNNKNEQKSINQIKKEELEHFYQFKYESRTNKLKYEQSTEITRKTEKMEQQLHDLKEELYLNNNNNIKQENEMEIEDD